MYKLIVICVLITVALAQPQTARLPSKPLLPHIIPENYRHSYAGVEIPILKQTQDIDAATGYQWSFSSGNGINAEETATIIPLGPELADKQVRGSYSYVSLEGIPVSVTYYADATGFHPEVNFHIGHVGQPVVHK
ncbi:hypothetical protein RN001_008612 [Aquatica leii]|uniref:Uncharacterized protein n=1 Tax=Aquatica leii TaxID=1421715 RepID=A0AAN7PDI9_9COLE|nr:hypothetical protein RN001_008612 [Aquatica leii]